MKYQILLIDDDVSFVEAVEYYFKDSDAYQIFKAYRGSEALRLLEGENFQLLLVDAMLPDTSGFELSYKIKKKNPLVQVIMLTALTSLEDKNRALHHHVDEFISKPVPLEELEIRIQSHLKMYDLTSRLEQTRKSFKNIVESLYEPIFVLDRTGDILYSNRFFRNQYGTLANLKDLNTFYPSEITDRFFEELEEFFNSPQEKNRWMDFKVNGHYCQIKYLRFMDHEDQVLGVLQNFTLGSEDSFYQKYTTGNKEIRQSLYMQKNLVVRELPVHKEMGFKAWLIPAANAGGGLIFSI